VKLNDSDLIGLPLRVVVSKRTLTSDGVEWKLRAEDEASTVAFADLINRVHEFLIEN